MNEDIAVQVLKLVRRRKRIPVSMIAYRLNIPGKFIEMSLGALKEYNLVKTTPQPNGDTIVEIIEEQKDVKRNSSLLHRFWRWLRGKLD